MTSTECTTAVVPTRPPPVPSRTGGSTLPDQLLEHLQLLADGVVAVAGFAVAAIRVRRGDDLELAVDTELPHEVGSRIPARVMLDELAVAEVWGDLRFVPHELSTGPQDAGWVVSEQTGPIALDSPDAWHPLDLLVAPLYDDDGVLQGTLAFDGPRDGLRPGPESRQVLERFAGLAARAVLTALQREALAEQVAMAETLKSVVRTSSAQLELTSLLRATEQTLLEGFAAQQLWLRTVDSEVGDLELVPASWRVDLPAEVVDLAAVAAGWCWHRQTVLVLGEGLAPPPPMSGAQVEQVLRLLRTGGASSLVFVPLGAGTECVGSLVLTRDDPRRAWTEVECRALLDIGHDLGRSVLNARTFEREHAVIAELKALDVYRTELLSTVSHELKSPLTTVKGNLEMLLEGTIAISEVARGSLDAIDRASRRMTRVIDDLLLLRQVGDPDRALHPAPVDLSTLVTDALDLTAAPANAKSLRVLFDPPSAPVRALGEADELDRVVLNLLSNAVKYTPARRDVRVSVEQDGTTAVLTVSDQGLGISAEDQAKLFSEFFRSTNPEARAVAGTGLGLSIVQRVVQRHGGRIEVDSALGRGSTFRVLLPAA